MQLLPNERPAWVNVSRDAVGFLGGVGAKLAQQKTPAFGQQQYIVDRQVLAQHVVDHQAIEAFKTDRLVLEHRGHVIRGNEGIGKAEHHQAAMLRAVLQHAARLQHRDAGAFRAHQCAGYVESRFPAAARPGCSRKRGAESWENAAGSASL